MATIHEVARRAGVGVGTVSRVLNGNPSVRDRTRERVQQAIDELDYRPSHAARNLALGRTLMIGVLMPFVTHRSAIERIRGVVERLASTPYDLVLFDVESPSRRDELFRKVADRSRIDGLLVVSIPPHDAEVERFSRARLPVVLVDTHHPRLAHVVVDDRGGGQLAVEHLLDLGHRRIGFVGDLPDAQFGFRASIDRLDGYREALRSADVSIDERLIRLTEFGHEWAGAAATELLRSETPPTAIFATSDTQALGVIDAVTRAGVRVPDQVSVIGFDDIDIARYAGLTTIRQPLEDTGTCGVDALLELLAETTTIPTSHELSVELVRRRTTAPPPEGA
jgi:LacI family transcriptional regulator